MPLSKNINTYADIAQVLAAVVASGAPRRTYRLPTVGQAVRFVQRTYQYRMLLQKQLAAQAGKGIQPGTPYDKMKMYREGADVLIDLAPPIIGSFVEEDGTETPAPLINEVFTAPAPAVAPSPVPPSGRPLALKDSMFLAELEKLAKDRGDED